MRIFGKQARFGLSTPDDSDEESRDKGNQRKQVEGYIGNTMGDQLEMKTARKCGI